MPEKSSAVHLNPGRESSTGQADLPHPALGQDLTPLPSRELGRDSSADMGRRHALGALAAIIQLATMLIARAQGRAR